MSLAGDAASGSREMCVRGARYGGGGAADEASSLRTGLRSRWTPMRRASDASSDVAAWLYRPPIRSLGSARCPWAAAAYVASDDDRYVDAGPEDTPSDAACDLDVAPSALLAISRCVLDSGAANTEPAIGAAGGGEASAATATAVGGAVRICWPRFPRPARRRAMRCSRVVGGMLCLVAVWVGG